MHGGSLLAPNRRTRIRYPEVCCAVLPAGARARGCTCTRLHVQHTRYDANTNVCLSWSSVCSVGSTTLHNLSTRWHFTSVWIITGGGEGGPHHGAIHLNFNRRNLLKVKHLIWKGFRWKRVYLNESISEFASSSDSSTFYPSGVAPARPGTGFRPIWEPVQRWPTLRMRLMFTTTVQVVS